MSFSLDGRTAVVTGAGAGIGAAVARAFAAAGAAVMVTDIDGSAAERVAQDIVAAGGRAESAALDVRDEAGARAIIEQAASLGDGHVHILVNNAGAIAPAMVGDLTEEAFRRIIDIHLVGSFVCSKAVLDRLPNDGTGRILNVTSAAGLTGTIGQANYGAAKAGITALTLSAARALGRFGVRANAIAPRARTAMTAGVFGDAPELPEGAVDPLSPDHVVNLVRFLASPAAEGVNGQLFIVYGPTVTLMAAPTAERQFSADGAEWDPADLSDTLRNYFADRDPERSFSAAMGLGDPH